MKRRILFAAATALAVVLCVTLYVTLGVVRDLRAARAALEGLPAAPAASDLALAEGHVSSALQRLDSVPARAVRLIPLIRQNLGSIRGVLGASLPLLAAASEVDAALEPIRRDGLITDGAVDLARLEALEDPVGRSEDALERLEVVAEGALSPVLLPPVWDLVAAVEDRSERSLATTRAAQAALAAAPELLGTAAPRTYLVVLINNAELRGAGGIPSGAGTIVADDGELILGEFRHTVLLRGNKPYETVRAPAEFRERFGQFDADTTFWTNTTFSPDVPDVALVASRLYRAVTGTATDGVIIIDPRGIAALLPEQAEIPVPLTETTVDRDSLAHFVYAGAYERLGGQGPRRDVLIELGERAFREVIGGGLRTEDDLLAAVRSARAGHIRIVPLHEEERGLLEAAGVTGDMRQPESDHLLVATQNSGGDKLDYWIQRHVEHSCRIQPAYADCSGSATFENLVPDDLTRYVAGRPYGQAQTFAEVYVPADADVTSIEVDGVPAPVFPAEQAGHFVAGVELTIPQGRAARVTWSYRLPIEKTYSITISPQPLARDATVQVRLEAPSGWAFDGPGDRDGNQIVYEGVLDAPLRMGAHPDARRGIPAAWDRLVRFWREPVF